MLLVPLWVIVVVVVGCSLLALGANILAKPVAWLIRSGRRSVQSARATIASAFKDQEK